MFLLKPNSFLMASRSYHLLYQRLFWFQHLFISQKCRDYVHLTRPTKKLDEIVKLSLLEKEYPERIKEIWNSYHAFKIDVISEAIKPSTYFPLQHRAQSCPNFVLPLHNRLGYENMYVQYQGPDVFLFTSLREFQTLRDHAVPLLVLQHFRDLEKSKELILVRGEVRETCLTKENALRLVKMLYHYYLTDDKFNRFIEVFNKTPHMFNFQAFLEEIEHSFPQKIIKIRKTEEGRLLKGKFATFKGKS